MHAQPLFSSKNWARLEHNYYFCAKFLEETFNITVYYFISSFPLTVGIDVVISTFGTLILPAGGPSTAAIPVSLVEDTIAEAREWFLVTISVSSDEGEVISGVGTANITILDNDRNDDVTLSVFSPI